MTALKYWDGAAWQTVSSVQGPQGVPGPQGPMGPVGTVYDTDQIGTVKTFAGAVIPTNWMLADGRSLARATYPDLFTALGGTASPYGLPDGASFNLPDLTSRFVYGASGPNANTKGGASTVTLDVTQIPSHSHNPASGSFFLTGTSGSSQRDDGPGGLSAVTGASAPTQAAGGGLSHPNMPPYILIAQIIKVTGVQVNSGGALVGPQGPPGSSVMVPMEGWHNIGAAGEPAFQNGWVNYGGVYAAVGFRKDPLGKVQLRGLVKTGASGTVAFTLPVGYRPPASMVFTCWASGSVLATVQINVDGTLGISGPAAVTTSTALDTVEFDTDGANQMPVGPQGPAGPGVRGLVSVLPALPADGDECYYQNTAMATDGIVWHLRYRVASASAYKWEFIGGPPLYAEGVASGGILWGTGAWGNFPTDPSITLPLAGEYVGETNTAMSATPTACTLWIGLRVAGANDALGGSNYYNESGHVSGGCIMYHRRKFTVVAGNAVATQFMHNAGGNNNLSRSMAALEIRPVRVA